jgi:hypothetical protein
MALAYWSESFAGMQPVPLESGSVSEEEAEAFATWKRANGPVF